MKLTFIVFEFSDVSTGTPKQRRSQVTKNAVDNFLVKLHKNQVSVRVLIDHDDDTPPNPLKWVASTRPTMQHHGLAELEASDTELWMSIKYEEHVPEPILEAIEYGTITGASAGFAFDMSDVEERWDDEGSFVLINEIELEEVSITVEMEPLMKSSCFFPVEY